MAFNINSLSLTQEEEKTLHWDGIVAVCTGKFQNLSEAKAHIGTGMLLKKAGVQGELFNAFHQEPVSAKMLFAINSGEKWGDIWFDETYAEMVSTKKELRKMYVELAIAEGTEGHWRLGGKKIQLEERLVALQSQLGMSQA